MDKELSVNIKTMPLTVKARTVQQAHEGGKMGWNVPKSTLDFFKDIRRPLIRSSPLSMLDECPRKFLYAYKLGITPVSYQAPLTMGSIVHKILECLFLGQSTDEAQAAAQTILAKEQQAMVGSADMAGFLPSGQALEVVLKKIEEDYHKARATALVFWSFVPFEPGEYEVVRTPDGTPMVELILEAEFPGLSRPARTPCDLVLKEKATGHIWIVDYKTTAFDPRIRVIPTKISPQLALYRLVLQSHFDAWHEEGLIPEKLTVYGSMHAIIKKPGIKYCPKTKDKEGFQSYIDRLIKWYKDADEKDPTNPPLVLDPNRFMKPVLTQELWGRLKQYCKAAYASPNIDSFYRVGDSVCLKYNKACPYMDLCNSDPVMWPDLIKSGKYEIKFREDEENRNDD